MPLHQADPRRSVIVSHDVACQFRRPFLPDPQENPVGYWADATSHPTWMVARWRDAYGLESAVRICRAGISRPPIVLRPNRLRIDAAGLQVMLQEEGITTERLPDADALVVTAGPSVLGTRAFEVGLFQPQDRTAMEVVPGVCQQCLEPGHIIIDMCAGLGTKATQLAEMTQDQGVIIATDKDADKLELLRANALRLGCQSIQIVPVSELLRTVAAAGGAHCVLVDAPCSNTGVLARRPEARYRLTMRAIEKLANLQSEVLAEAAELLRPAGRLIYVTCSIDPHENEHVASRFCHAHPDWQLLDTRLTLPDAGPRPPDWRDGGFRAVWKKPA
jgi:16S rRNA (cytosine967-C5)-methyltransferase